MKILHIDNLTLNLESIILIEWKGEYVIVTFANSNKEINIRNSKVINGLKAWVKMNSQISTS